MASTPFALSEPILPNGFAAADVQLIYHKPWLEEDLYLQSFPLSSEPFFVLMYCPLERLPLQLLTLLD